jgi:hypothetical protein
MCSSLVSVTSERAMSRGRDDDDEVGEETQRFITQSGTLRGSGRRGRLAANRRESWAFRCDG